MTDMDIRHAERRDSADEAEKRRQFAEFMLKRRIEDSRKIVAERSDLVGVLRSAGVAVMEADYSGSGDEGNVDALMFYGPAGKEDVLDPFVLPETVHRRVFDFVFDALYFQQGSWETNEGGQGMFCWNVAGDVIDIDHEINVIEVIPAGLKNLDFSVETDPEPDSGDAGPEI